MKITKVRVSLHKWRTLKSHAKPEPGRGGTGIAEQEGEQEIRRKINKEKKKETEVGTKRRADKERKKAEEPYSRECVVCEGKTFRERHRQL